MVVTDVKIDKYHPKDLGTCAECSIVLDNCLCIHKILVIMGKKGEFIAFPSEGGTYIEGDCKRYRDIVHPVNKTLTESISRKVIESYHDYVLNN